MSLWQVNRPKSRFSRDRYGSYPEVPQNKDSLILSQVNNCTYSFYHSSTENISSLLRQFAGMSWQDWTYSNVMKMRIKKKFSNFFLFPIFFFVIRFIVSSWEKIYANIAVLFVIILVCFFVFLLILAWPWFSCICKNARDKLVCKNGKFLLKT